MKASDFAKRVLALTLQNEGKHLNEYAKPMAAFVVRFSGDKLAHVGNAVDAALDRVLALAKRPVTFRGFLTKGTKRTRYNSPKTIDGPGRKLLTGALATLKAMPKEASTVYLTDGTADRVVPQDFAAYFSLAKDAGNTFATGKGFLSVALPMDSLTNAQVLATVDELVVLLAAEVAWLGPALWLAPHNLFNSSSNNVEKARTLIALWGEMPQLEIPSFFASRSPHDFDEYEPSALAGLLGPAWVMWLGAALAKKVKSYRGETTKLHGGATRYHATKASPFEMTDAIYAEYKARWAELAPAHVTHPSESIEAIYHRDRFAAKSFGVLHADWKAAFEAAEAREQRGYEISSALEKLAHKADAKLLAYAESVAKELTAQHGWYFLPGLRNLLEAGKAKADEATVWLDHFEQLNDDDILPKLAAVAAASAHHDRAIDLLRRAIKAGRVDPKHLARDSDYKPLRKHAAWKKLAGSARPRS